MGALPQEGDGMRTKNEGGEHLAQLGPMRGGGLSFNARISEG